MCVCLTNKKKSVLHGLLLLLLLLLLFYTLFLWSIIIIIENTRCRPGWNPGRDSPPPRGPRGGSFFVNYLAQKGKIDILC